MKKEVKILKVWVRLNNGEDFFARLFVNPTDRLQDLLNDDRKFLPMEKHMQNRGRGNEDIWVMTVIHKDSIMLIEER